MFKPMPSPRGTNYEGLFVPAHWIGKSPAMAFDQKLNELNGDVLKRLLTFLSKTLTDADLDTVMAILRGEEGGQSQASAMAADARRKPGTFYERYPDAARIGVV